MDRDQVRKLEEAIEAAIVQALDRLSGDHALGRSVTGRTYHLMSKAAVAVYEAVLEEQQARGK